jgi:hypothetical protein
VVTIIDQGNGRKVDGRCYLTDATGHLWVPSGAITYIKPPERDFIALGSFEIELPPGMYTLRVERGTEYRRYDHQIEIKGGEILRERVGVSRWVNMNDLGWYSGDLPNHRDWREMPQILLSEDLNLAPTTTNWVWVLRTISIQPPAGEQAIRRVDATHAYSVYGTEIERNVPGPGAIDFDPVTRDIELEDDSVMNKAVNHCCRGHRIFEDASAFRKRQIAGDEDAATLVTFGQRSEQHFHFFPALLHVPEIINDQAFEVRQFFEEAAELEVAFGDQ